jgi:hypothetical protein
MTGLDPAIHAAGSLHGSPVKPGDDERKSNEIYQE